MNKAAFVQVARGIRPQQKPLLKSMHGTPQRSNQGAVRHECYVPNTELASSYLRTMCARVQLTTANTPRGGESCLGPTREQL
ncbi:hypothetical protein Y1Q_0002618 [Alligator mississippiensis]|uniref:Uncharacterized protein n=1 Tax=Alligator mississippiensis TaxID=8496 RepID=A0A151NYK7_ALLMI|nr:hypothetical protein Y1Q_0002618 [Alligator mississippiensis]